MSNECFTGNTESTCELVFRDEDKGSGQMSSSHRGTEEERRVILRGPEEN